MRLAGNKDIRKISLAVYGMAKDRNLDQWAHPAKDSLFREKLSEVRNNRSAPEFLKQTNQKIPAAKAQKHWAQQTLTDPVLLAPSRLSAQPAMGSDDIERLAFLDPETGLLNARTFLRKLKYELKRGKRYRRPVALMLIAIDQMESVRQQSGPGGIKDFLAALADRICGSIRDVDLAARFGEDVFAIAFPETNATGVGIAAERIRNSIRCKPIANAYANFLCTSSIGIASFPAHAAEYDEMMAKATHALEMAGEKGGNGIYCG